MCRGEGSNTPIVMVVILHFFSNKDFRCSISHLCVSCVFGWDEMYEFGTFRFGLVCLLVGRICFRYLLFGLRFELYLATKDLFELN